MIDPKIFDTLLEPTFILDANNHVHYCNEPAALLCDSSVRKIMRTRPVFTSLIQFSESVAALQSITTLEEPSPYQEVSFRTESGKSGRVQLTLQPAGETGRWLVFFRDVTLEETLQRKYRGELEKKESVIRALEEAQKKLEDYSRNLENMVAERTAQLSRMNAQMSALLDSLDQGFLIFDASGACQEIASKACSTVFDINPRGLAITDVLRLDPKSSAAFRKWMTTAFAEMLPFEDLIPLAPERFDHPQGRHINLNYYPLRSSAGQIEGIVLVGTDVSDLVAAQEQAVQEKAYAEMIIHFVRNRRQVLGFIHEAQELVNEIEKQLNAPKLNYEESFRALHTLKGGAASFSIQPLVEELHHAESALAEWQNRPGDELLQKLQEAAQAVKFRFQIFLSETESLFGGRRTEQEPRREISSQMLKRFHERLQVAPELQQQFLQDFLMDSAEEVFGHFNETVQMTAQSLGKRVAPVYIETPGFRFYAEPYQSLLGTLVHAFRNAVDHGIELPEQRLSHGKSADGHIRIALERVNQNLILRITDDGAGIDPQKIRDRLTQKGVPTADQTDLEVIQHVFDSAFSTREQLTELSGRGVGMDAIRATAEELGGRVWVRSEIGRGTELGIEIPWIERPTSTSARAA